MVISPVAVSDAFDLCLDIPLGNDDGIEHRIYAEKTTLWILHEAFNRQITIVPDLRTEIASPGNIVTLPTLEAATTSWQIESRPLPGRELLLSRSSAIQVSLNDQQFIRF